MELIQERNGSKLTIKIEGILNTLTAPELDAALGDNLADVDVLILDASKMEYTSSAGLRVILAAQQYMDDKNGRMTLRGVSEDVMDVFVKTGFDMFLDFE